MRKATKTVGAVSVAGKERAEETDCSKLKCGPGVTEGKEKMGSRGKIRNAR
jgi:hypothetical protein